MNWFAALRRFLNRMDAGIGRFADHVGVLAEIGRLADYNAEAERQWRELRRVNRVAAEAVLIRRD